MRRVKIADPKIRPRGMLPGAEGSVARALGAIAAVGILILTLTTSALAIELDVFQMPSGSIACGYAGAYVDAMGRANPPSLRCDIRGGLKPKPSRMSRPASCDGDWGDSVTLSPTGRTALTCHGDTVLNPRAKVLRYGTTWTRGPFTCTSRTAGLTCQNTARHGFFLSSLSWRRF